MSVKLLVGPSQNLALLSGTNDTLTVMWLFPTEPFLAVLRNTSALGLTAT